MVGVNEKKVVEEEALVLLIQNIYIYIYIPISRYFSRYFQDWIPSQYVMFICEHLESLLDLADTTTR